MGAMLRRNEPVHSLKTLLFLCTQVKAWGCLGSASVYCPEKGHELTIRDPWDASFGGNEVR